MATKIHGSFERALNDAKVEVCFCYPFRAPDDAELTEVRFKGVDIYDTMHPEDQAYFAGMIVEKAHEYDRKTRAYAEEARWEADREERLLAQG